MKNKEKLFQKWKKHITDDLIFTDLCNKVLWFNVPSEDRLKLILYGAEKAKDKGVDAELEGTFMGQKGKWIFQYKFFDLSKNPQSKAKYSLKTALLTGNKTRKEKPELEKAMLLNPTKYVIFTNIELTKDFLDEVLKEAKKMGATFDIMFRDIVNLDPVILNEPLLEISFFGSKPFYFVKEFKEQFKNEGKIIRHDFKLYWRGEEKKQFQRFIDGKKNVLIITGAAGVGKTRFIIEMAEELQNNGVVPIFLKSDIEVQGDEILKISETKSRYAIFIDDAHEYDKIHSLLKLASYRKCENFKFILTTRNQLKEYIMASANPEDLVLLQLDPFPQKILSEFLENELNVTDSKIRLHIWQLTRGLPLFAILCADIVKEKKLQPLDITKEKLIEYWIKKFLSDLEKGEQKNKIEFLKVLAAVEPVSSTNEELLEAISNFLNVQGYELERIINHLCELGYIKKFGRMIKINHDIIGNYLLYQTNIKNPRFLDKIRDTFLKYATKNVLTNLATAEYLGQNDLLSQFLKEELLENISSLNISKRLTIVESLETLAFFRPSEVLEIVEKIMHVPAEEYTYKDKIFGEVDLTNASVLKETPSVLRNVSFSFDDLEGAMKLLKEIALVESTPDNYSTSAKAILRDDIVGYQALKPIIFNEKAVGVLKGWAGEKKPEVDALIIDALSGIFAREIHETLPSDESPNAFQLRRYKVNRESISRLRLAAINFLIDFAKGGEKSTCIKALNQLHISDPDDEELKIILDFVDRYIKKEKDLSILHSLNHILAHFRSYCDRKSKLDFVEKINLLTNRLESSNLEYTLYRWLVGMGADDVYLYGAKKFDSEIKEKIKELAIEIPEKIPSNRLGGIINQIFDERAERPIYSHYFSVFLGENHPGYAMDLLSFFVDNGVCDLKKSDFLGRLIKGIEKTKTMEAKSIVNEIYSMRGCWWNVIVNIVNYLFICDENIDKNYFDMLIKIASNGLEETKLLLIKSLGLSPEKLEDDKWWTIIATISKSDNKSMDKQIVESVYNRINKNVEELEKHLDAVKEVVERFEYSNDLDSGTMDWFYLGNTMNQIFKFDPLWVLGFLEKRIEFWAEGNAPKDFRPIPFGNVMEYVFEGIKEDDEKQKKTIRWLLSLAQKGPLYSFESTIIFESISPTIDDKIKNILMDWAKEDIEGRLETIASIIRECENDQSFFDLARDILELSEGNVAVLSSLSASIHTTRASIAWSLVPILEERKKMMEEWMKSPKSWARTFAKKEIGYLDRQIQFWKDEEAELFYA